MYTYTHVRQPTTLPHSTEEQFNMILGKLVAQQVLETLDL